MRIYLDYASITPTDKRVVKEVKKWYSKDVGNPSSLHAEGVAAQKVVRAARESIARSLHAHADEIIFTASGTEANNLAIFGAINDSIDPKNAHIITSIIEHASVLEPIRELERRGAKVDYIPVLSSGEIDLEVFKKKLTPATTLVSVHYVNNEIGTLQPIAEIAKLVRRIRGDKTFPLLHIDASQAVLCHEINMEKLSADLVTLDAHKMYGPKGIGMLYVRRGTELTPHIYGGGQERGLRSGTENVPAIMGFAKAFELTDKERAKTSLHLQNLRSYLRNLLPAYKVHGGELVSPHIFNMQLDGYDAEAVMIRLDAQGIACSTKSSCLRDADESFVLKAIGANSRSSLRVSFGKNTTQRELRKFVAALQKVLPKSQLTQ